MLLVIPISHVDLVPGAKMLRRICDYGDMKDEHLLIVATWRAAWDIDNFVKYAEKHFASVTLHRATTENEMGWPESSNHLFYECALAATEARYRDPMPFYLMECDNVAVRPGWFRDLKKEYYDVGKRFMGAVNKSRWFNLDRSEEEVRGEHMVGTGCYPADFFTTSKLVHQLDIVPWDVAIQDEVMPDCHSTALIAHRWNTKNYRRREEDGVIIMDPIDPLLTRYVDPIPPAAAIIHGCKDGSLDTLLRTS